MLALARLLAPVPRRGGSCTFVLPSSGEEAQTLPGALAPLSVLPELVGDPETLIVDSTLLEVLHPRQVNQSAGFDGAAWVRWGSFSVYGVELHLLCATNRVPLSYELAAANVAEIRLVGERLGEAGLGDLEKRWPGNCWGPGLPQRGVGGRVGRKFGVALVTERSGQNGGRQQVEVEFSILKRTFGIERTLAKTLVGLATRIVAKIAAYTYAFFVNRIVGRPQGRIKELWA